MLLWAIFLTNYGTISETNYCLRITPAPTPPLCAHIEGSNDHLSVSGS